MKIRLNIFAFFYAFVFFVQTQLMVNVYPIERIMGWVNEAPIAILNLMIFIVTTVLFCFFTHKHFTTGKIKYLLTILWIPYFFAMIWLFTPIFLWTNAGDEPAPVLGFLLIGLFLTYPLYIFLVTLICSKDKKREEVL